MVLAKKCDYFGRDVFNASQVRCFTLLITVHTVAPKQLTHFNASHRVACTLAGRKLLPPVGCVHEGWRRPPYRAAAALVDCTQAAQTEFQVVWLGGVCRIFFGFGVFHSENRIGQNPFPSVLWLPWSAAHTLQIITFFRFYYFQEVSPRIDSN